MQRSVRSVLDLADEPADIRRRVATLGALAVALSSAGDSKTAQVVIARARQLIDVAPEAVAKREALLSEIATALADLGHLDEASRLLDQIDDTRHHPPVMLAAAKAYLRDGRDEEAFETATAVPEERYKVVALGRVAVAQYRAGDKKRALETLQNALDAADEIDSRAAYARAYARAYAVSQVVHAFIAIDFRSRNKDCARHPGRSIARRRLLEHCRRASEIRPNESAVANFKRAKQALADVRSPLDRSWIMSNLVVSQIRAKDLPAAEEGACASRRNYTTDYQPLGAGSGYRQIGRKFDRI